MKVLAIIPAYNEEGCIEATVDEFVRTCPGVDYLVVNDGSSDQTEAICKRRGFNYVSHPVNLGLTGGFQTGCRYALENGYESVSLGTSRLRTETAGLVAVHMAHIARRL